MKAAVLVALALVAATAARADWKDLKPGMDRAAAQRCVGTPLIESKGRAASGVWTFDAGGYVLFAGGRVSYWEQPKPAKPNPRATAQKPKTLPPAGRLAKS